MKEVYSYTPKVSSDSVCLGGPLLFAHPEDNLLMTFTTLMSQPLAAS